MTLTPPPEGLCGEAGCVFLDGHGGPHTWDTQRSAEAVAENPHPDSPRITILIRADQLEAVEASSKREGFHHHLLGKPDAGPNGPEMPDAQEGEVWVTICAGYPQAPA